MALDTNSTLISLKLQALGSIIQSMVIDYPAMKNTLSNLSQTSSSFSSLLNLYAPTFTKLTSFDVNGSMLLAYLDFYTLYIILYANIDPIANLQNLTNNKMSYLLSVYKDTNSIIKEKTLQKDNKYVFYTDFFNPKGIDLTISKVYLLRDKLSDALNLSPVLTLPIESTENVNVLSVLSTDTDSYINIIENNNNGNDIDYSVNRKGFNKIGVVDYIVPLRANNQYNSLPIISGTIHGYFSESISIALSDVTTDTNGLLLSVSIIGSSDNLTWSNPTVIPMNIPTEFYIDNAVDIGMTITFSSNFIPAVGDSWKVNLRYIDIDNPMLVSAIKFMTLKKVSFVTWDDLTKNSVNFISHRVKYRQAEKYKNLNSSVFGNGINNITPVFNNVNDYELTVKQNLYHPKAINSDLTHAFDFNLRNIHGVYNEYSSYGITSFTGISATTDSPILSVSLSSNEYISNNYFYTVQPKTQTQITSWNLDFSGSNIKVGSVVFWTLLNGVITLYDTDENILSTGTYGTTTLITFNGQITGTAKLNRTTNNIPLTDYVIVVSKQFIEHTLLVTMGKDTLFIPALNMTDANAGNLLNEYVVLNSDNTYTSRFPLGTGLYDFTVCDISSGEILTEGVDYTFADIAINGDTPLNVRRKITFINYDVKSVYSVLYTPLRNSYTEATVYIPNSGSWIYNQRAFTSDIYYMYYIDIDGNNKIALCTADITDTLTPFPGSVSSIVEMRSLDQGYVSPVVFEYTLLGN